MKTLFVMDPLSAIVVEGDSTYALMRECSDRSFDVWMCTPSDMFASTDGAFATATPVVTTNDAPYFRTNAPQIQALGDFDVVWMRKDPPFDMSYIFSTYLLDMAPSSTLVVNNPDGLKRFNEKMWVLHQWPHLHPKTLVSRDIDQIRAFAKTLPDKMVLKPWDGNGGRGVVVTHATDSNLSSLCELLTGEGRDYAIAQQYLPAVRQGDKRVLLFDGEPVAAMLRVPDRSEHRANMHVGATVEPCELTDRDREICDAIGSALRENGLVFTGIDIIGDQLTEINVTSPTGIRELNRLYGLKLEGQLLDCVLRQHRQP